MKIAFDYSSKTITVDLTATGNFYRLTIDGETIEAETLQARDGRVELLVDGKRVTAYISSDNARRWVTVNGQTILLTKSSGARRGGHAGHRAPGELTAPMPGQVRAVNVAEGDAVAKGQTLMVLEAMKMEIRIHAPREGTVKKLFVQQAQTVEREQILIEIEESLPRRPIDSERA